MKRAVLVLIVLAGACKTMPPRCASADFSIGASHMTNELSTPFVVRELRGRFVPDFTDDKLPDWAAGALIRFQVNGTNGRAILVPIAPDGTFHVRNVPPGEYCFHTSSQLLQGYTGTIIIDPRAKATSFAITVALGA